MQELERRSGQQLVRQGWFLDHRSENLFGRRNHGGINSCHHESSGEGWTELKIVLENQLLRVTIATGQQNRTFQKAGFINSSELITVTNQLNKSR